MDFRVLGDLSVAIDGDRRPVTAARQRGALAILLLSANRTVAARSLIEGIWGASLPQHPDTALQIVISRLRTSLGPAAHRLVSMPAGYRLDVGPDELDLALARAALARAEQLRHDCDPERAVSVLDAALASWTNEPLLDLAAFPFCAVARQRLRELKLALYELRNDVLLDASRHVEVLETIDDWLRDEPWREQLRAQHMLALYRSGRQVDALRAYDEYRERLVAELGVEPRRELCELHRNVLSHAPSLAADAGALGSRIPLWTSLVMPFVGRADNEERMFSHIRDAVAGRASLVLIDGELGIGKTRLVLEVARRVQRDAIVVAVTGNDALCPAVVALARALVDAMSPLPDEQLRAYLGADPQAIASAVPAVGERLPDLAPAAGDPAVADSRLAKAVNSCAVALSERAPIVLLLDDLHRAGVPFLVLLGHLISAERSGRIAVLATSCSPSAQRSSSLADLADSLERRGRLERMQLGGLTRASVERLLVRLGVRDPEPAAQLLHQVTGGHPFFLHEILQCDDWQRALVDPPAGVRDFVRRRVHALGNAAEAVLVDASGLSVAFDIALISEISGVPQATTTSLIDQAVAAGVLRTVDKTTFSFAHELSRRSLLDRLDVRELSLLHQRIATALEGRGFPAVVIAWHRSNVSGLQAAGELARPATPVDVDLTDRASDENVALRSHQ